MSKRMECKPSRFAYVASGMLGAPVSFVPIKRPALVAGLVASLASGTLALPSLALRY